jgi:hypothetical protein
MSERSRNLKIAAIASAIGTLLHVIERDWIGAGITGPLAVSLALMSAGVSERSTRGRWLNYIMLAASFVAIGFDIFS